MEQNEWTIKDAERQFYGVDVLMCRDTHEEINAKAIHGIEIRRLADYWKKHGKLTPGDVAIAEKYGWKG